MPKRFFEVHGLITLDPGTKREREVWHPVICVTSEQDRDRMFRSLFSEKGDEYAKRNGTGKYEDFKKVDPEPLVTTPERRRKVEYVRASPQHVDLPGEQGTATTGEVGTPRRRRRRQKAAATPEPRPQPQRASTGRSGGAKTEDRPRSRSRRRRGRSTDA